jgi:hypothetical protein
MTKIKDTLSNGEQPAIAKPLVSGSLPINELEDFFYEMGEDWHLWDEEEQGQYPIQRIFDAMKKFIETKKAAYWITAPPEEVKKYLSENTNIKEYELKKQKLLCEIQKKLK